jgi:hypothetical protein
MSGVLRTLTPVNEQTFILPASWRRSIHPRRGGAAVAYEPQGGALPDPAPAQRVLAHPATPEDLREAALAAGPGPLGVAALWAALLGTGARYQLDDVRVVADDWIVRHGVVFAARTAAEFAGLWVRQRAGERNTAQGGLALMRLDDRGDESAVYVARHLLARVRLALADAPEDVYAQAVEALAEMRGGSMYHRLSASFLAPAESGWVRRDIEEVPERHALARLLVASVSTVDEATAVLSRLSPTQAELLQEAETLHTLAEAIGDGILDVYAGYWTGRSVAYTMSGVPQFMRDMAATLPAIPTDRAFQALIDQADQRGVHAGIIEAADRFPVRAMRLLQASAARPRVADLLRRHAARHPDLAPPGLRPPDAPRPGEAPAESLPAVLATPPWAARRKAAKPLVLDLRCPDEPALTWPPGKRERLIARLPGFDRHKDYEDIARQVESGVARDWEAGYLFLAGPKELGRRLLGAYRPYGARWGSSWLQRAAARFGVDAYPLVMNAVRMHPADGEALMPFTSPEIALLMAGWLARLKQARKTALAWLLAHPAEASRALVPAALGKAGVQRRQAGAALVALAGAGHRDTVLRAAAGYGDPAATAIADLLDADPLLQLPTRIPQPPDWADPVVLPPVRLRDGAGTLPADAVRHLLTMLMLSKAGEPYAGIAIVRSACEPFDLARLGWELQCRWEGVDAPPGDSWALDAQAFLGDDATAEGLAEAVQRWPYEGAHKRAAAGLDTLMHLGTEAALRQLHEISTKARAKAVRTRAETNLAETAQAIGLTAEELADRLVPHFDLAPDATMTLDYGPRRFIAGFDEQLRPYVTDEHGTRRKDLPAPGARDDAELAGAAQARFAAAKKGVRKVAGEQVRRLEWALAGGRRWGAAEFGRVFLSHPLLWQLARRLVWITGEPGSPGTALRIAEDRTFADLADEPYDVPGDAVLGVAHPVDLDTAAWSEVFADYDVLQPFPQLRRRVCHLTGDEAAAVRLARFDERRAMSVKLIALERRGWRRAGMEGAHQTRMERDLPSGRQLIVALDPGIVLGAPGDHPEQRLADVWICPADGDAWAAERTVPFGLLDAASASEILADLESCL